MAGLFRQEALRTQRLQWLGATRLATPVSHQVWGGVATLISAAILLWLFFGHYTQREHVSGTLVPQAGLLNITAREAGTVTKLDVIEGAHVREGAPLVEISSDRNSATLGNVGAAINTQLLKQQAKLQSDLLNTRRVAKEQATDFRMQQRMLRTQIGQINAQIAIERREAGRLSHLLKRFQPLVEKGYVSALEIQQQREQVSSTEAEVKNSERQRSQAEQQLASIGDQLVELSPTTTTKLNGLQEQLAQNRQAQIQNAVTWKNVLRAPQSGVVSNVLIYPGQTVASGQALVTVMPEGSSLQAQLLVPSSAIGFVHNGTPVALHYQAFPYQKFGVQRGTVVNVSRSALTPEEITALLGQPASSKPVYRVDVKLAEQSIEAYGQRHALLPGMSLDADLLLDRRRMIEWIFEPLYGMAKGEEGKP